MAPSLIGRDLIIRLAGSEVEALTGATRTGVAILDRAVLAAWPAATWEWMHGERTLERVVAALVARVDGYVSDGESYSSFHGPLGDLVAQAGGTTLAWRVTVHATVPGIWELAIEPRLRRKHLWGAITSHSIPGRSSFDGPTGEAVTRTMNRVLTEVGGAARDVPGNPRQLPESVLVFP